MKILRAKDYRRMPWKNGGGETVEIAVFPPQASVGDFDWRISMASVAADGPFSLFEGVDRTLSVLTGEGIALAVQGDAPILLRAETPPHAFAADKPTSASLLGGPITDLNVMTRRGQFAHRVTRLDDRELRVDAPAEGLTLVLSLGACRVEVLGGDDAHALEPLDAVILHPGETSIAFVGAGAARFFRVELRPLP